MNAAVKYSGTWERDEIRVVLALGCADPQKVPKSTKMFRHYQEIQKGQYQKGLGLSKNWLAIGT